MRPVLLLNRYDEKSGSETAHKFRVFDRDKIVQFYHKVKHGGKPAKDILQPRL